MLEGDPRDGQLQNQGNSKDALPPTGHSALQGQRSGQSGQGELGTWLWGLAQAAKWDF